MTYAITNRIAYSIQKGALGSTFLEAKEENKLAVSNPGTNTNIVPASITIIKAEFTLKDGDD